MTVSVAAPAGGSAVNGAFSPQRRAIESILGTLDTLVFVIDHERSTYSGTSMVVQCDIFPRLAGASPESTPPSPIFTACITSSDIFFGKYEARLFDPNAGVAEVMRLDYGGNWQMSTKNIGTKVTCGGSVIGYSTIHFSPSGSRQVFRHTEDISGKHDPESLQLKTDATPVCGYICCAFLCFFPTVVVGSCVAFYLMTKHETKGYFKDARGTKVGAPAVLMSKKEPYGAMVCDVAGWSVTRKLDVLAMGVVHVANEVARPPNNVAQ